MLKRLHNETMDFIMRWIDEKNTLVPRKSIIFYMESQGIKNYKTINALNYLVKHGYIRRSTLSSNKTNFILLRRIKLD